MTSLPIAITPDNIDFVLTHAPDIVFLRFPDGEDDEPVYKDRARSVLKIMIDLVNPAIVYHCLDAVFTITF